MKFSAARLYGDDGTDCAALDEELFDDVVLDPLDGQPDVDVFGEGSVTGERTECSITTDKYRSIGLHVCVWVDA